MSENAQYGIVITTFSEPESMRKCIAGLLDERLAACIQQVEGMSAYRWEGKVAEEKETIVFIKTRADLYPQVEAFLVKNHTYDVPEIVFVPITNGSTAYLAWMDAECAATAGA